LRSKTNPVVGQSAHGRQSATDAGRPRHATDCNGRGDASGRGESQLLPVPPTQAVPLARGARWCSRPVQEAFAGHGRPHQQIMGRCKSLILAPLMTAGPFPPPIVSGVSAAA
jgi:hypothetical protein